MYSIESRSCYFFVFVSSVCAMFLDSWLLLLPLTDWIVGAGDGWMVGCGLRDLCRAWVFICGLVIRAQVPYIEAHGVWFIHSPLFPFSLDAQTKKFNPSNIFDDFWIPFGGQLASNLEPKTRQDCGGSHPGGVKNRGKMEFRRQDAPEIDLDPIWDGFFWDEFGRIFGWLCDDF